MRIFCLAPLVLVWTLLGCGATVVPLPGTVFCSAAVEPSDMAQPRSCTRCTITFCNGAEGAPCSNCPSGQACLPGDLGAHCCGYPQGPVAPPPCKPAVQGSP